MKSQEIYTILVTNEKTISIIEALLFEKILCLKLMNLFFFFLSNIFKYSMQLFILPWQYSRKLNETDNCVLFITQQCAEITETFPQYAWIIGCWKMKAAYQDSRAVPTKALIERRSLETSFTLPEYLQTGRSPSPPPLLEYCCIFVQTSCSLFDSSSICQNKR